MCVGGRFDTYMHVSSATLNNSESRIQYIDASLCHSCDNDDNNNNNTYVNEQCH